MATAKPSLTAGNKKKRGLSTKHLPPIKTLAKKYPPSPC
jgi:hypothetical protein